MGGCRGHTRRGRSQAGAAGELSGTAVDRGFDRSARGDRRLPARMLAPRGRRRFVALASSRQGSVGICGAISACQQDAGATRANPFRGAGFQPAGFGRSLRGDQRLPARCWRHEGDAVSWRWLPAGRGRSESTGRPAPASKMLAPRGRPRFVAQASSWQGSIGVCVATGACQQDDGATRATPFRGAGFQPAGAGRSLRGDRRLPAWMPAPRVAARSSSRRLQEPTTAWICLMGPDGEVLVAPNGRRFDAGRTVRPAGGRLARPPSPGIGGGRLQKRRHW